MIDLSKFTLPDLPYNILISLVIASVVALFFSFFRGSSLPRLIFAVLVSIGGFAVGQLVGNYFGWQFILIGGVHVVEGLIGSVLALFIFASR